MRKRPVAILGATGAVGRRLARMLVEHPWFELAMLVGTSSSAGEAYGAVWERKEEALARHYGLDTWTIDPCPALLADRRVDTFERLAQADIEVVFSSIPERAGELEDTLLAHNRRVFSNSPHGRFESNNPLVVTEINGAAIGENRFVKNPNCVSSGLCLVLAALESAYGLDEVSVTTFQSLSGRGDAKYPPDLVVGNVYPLHGSSENTETYIFREVHKILPVSCRLSVSCQRVFVQEGHYVDVRVKTRRRGLDSGDVRERLAAYAPLQALKLPSAPARPLIVIEEPGRPRPSQDAWHAEGMAIAVGNVSTDDEVYDVRLNYVVNNLIRGAAGGAVLNAEYWHASAQARAVHGQ
ncbi:Asd/ArgC dimerization domain-containing protein [Pendulispora albinea]|uniref:Semialdehyde dehydrogenase NAD-binding domain-containing protein n=1 Tax=Pendulispora albinea TaxID=2741071 RepID=A0ABZ2MB93_9BACT